MCDAVPIELSVVVPPHVIPHPCLVIVVVKTSNVFRAPVVTKASRVFCFADEDRLPKVLAGGIPSYTDGQPIFC